jgi:3-oxoacyl-[acyl-carrier-protein] synthase III
VNTLPDHINPSDDEALQELRLKIEQQDIQWLMSHESGRRIVNTLLEYCGIWRCSVGANNDETNLNEGRRSVGLRLVALIEQHTPDGFARVLIERNRPLPQE